MTAVYRRFGCKMAALTTVRNPFADQRLRGLATAAWGWATRRAYPPRLVCREGFEPPTSGL
ncbi:MAG: hypothetical protein V3T55_06110 [Anaerolineales bacterium]